MRILHTSDWHVGKAIRGRPRTEEHVAVLDEVAEIAAAESADLVLVTGDLFDSAAPPPEAERVVFRALLELAATGASVVVIAGNHDNERRLQAVTPLLELGRITTRAMVIAPADGGVVEVPSRDGVETAVIACIPFLSQRYAVKADALMSGEGADHAQAYSARVARIVELMTRGFRPDAVNLVAAHLMVDGGTLGGGERLAQTIFDYAVAPNVFPPSAHYVALGHLHRMQKVPAPCPAWYAGSPLALDFGESGDTKGVVLIEASPGTPARAPQPISVTSGRRLVEVRGTLAALAAQGESGLLPAPGTAWIKAVVEEPVRVGLADDVRAVIPDAVDVVVAPPSGEDGPARRAVVATAGRAPSELFAAYLADRKIDDPRLVTLFGELLEAHGAA